MKHSIDELVALARHYQLSVRWKLSCGEDEDEGDREKWERQLDAGELAGKKYPIWRAMHRRIMERLPGCAVHDGSYYLQARPSCDGPFRAWLELPEPIPNVKIHRLAFYLSTLVPYYLIYGEESYYIPGTADKPGPEDEEEENKVPPVDYPERYAMSFELTPEEEPYARVLAEEIEATFGFEYMPPEVGKEVVPDVSTSQSGPEESTLYNCFFVGHW